MAKQQTETETLKLPAQFEPLKKITTKSCCGEIRTLIKKQKDERKPFFLMRIAGVVSMTRTGTGNYGEYINFLGSFRAITPEIDDDGNNRGYMAPKALLPRFLEEQLAALFMEAGEPVKFAFDIYVKPDPKDIERPTAMGYEFTATALKDASPEAEDFLREFTSVGIDTRLLPAPKDVKAA